MIILYDTQKIEEMATGLVATTGFFDGVHLGHRHLIREMGEAARIRRLPTAVITFPAHPRTVLQADYQPKLLNTFEEKLEQLAATGVDYCIVLPFTKELSLFTAEQFIRSILVERLRVKTLLTGYDHRFGHGRTDRFEQYEAYGKACGLETLKASPYTDGGIAVSSSEIRRQLADGRVETAAQLLTYPYRLKGHIVGGQRIGRIIGFPTANIQVDDPAKVIPGTGVYAVRVEWKGKRYNGMLYIGSRPTVEDDGHITLEVNIFDFDNDIYTNEVTVSFIYYIRGDIRFDSLEALKEQLERDRETVNNLLSKDKTGC
ncbi:MAG: riboflavin biosynthesis protein RibF [Tannerellaceae bacterium]|jgi:riboflavin kinase/FMN adenylyltransferase|nr:riboflavin biosynthesis protein RibF [Tannerellaceae bacterium]